MRLTLVACVLPLACALLPRVQLGRSVRTPCGVPVRTPSRGRALAKTAACVFLLDCVHDPNGAVCHCCLDGLCRRRWVLRWWTRPFWRLISCSRLQTRAAPLQRPSRMTRWINCGRDSGWRRGDRDVLKDVCWALSGKTLSSARPTLRRETVATRPSMPCVGPQATSPASSSWARCRPTSSSSTSSTTKAPEPAYLCVSRKHLSVSFPESL